MRGIGLTEDRSVSRNALFQVRGGDFVSFHMRVEMVVFAAVFVF